MTTRNYPREAIDVEDPAAPVVAGTPRAEPIDDTSDDVDLLPGDARRDFEARWREIQAMFVDDPRQAVDQADSLVGEVAQSLTAGFSRRKAALEQHAAAGEEAETEELRQALRSYRALFERVLKI